MTADRALTSSSEHLADAATADARTQQSCAVLTTKAKLQAEDDGEADLIKDGHKPVITAQTSTNDSVTATMTEDSARRALICLSEHLTDAAATSARTQDSRAIIAADAKTQVEDGDEANSINDSNTKRHRLAVEGGPCNNVDPPAHKRFKPLPKQHPHLESDNCAKIGKSTNPVGDVEVDGAVMITDSSSKQVMSVVANTVR